MEVYETMFQMFQYAFNILSIYANIRTIRLFLRPKETKKACAFCLYTILWLTNSYIYLNFQSFLLTATTFFIALLTITIFLYNGSFLRKILAVIASQTLGNAIENIFWVWMEAEKFNQIDELTGSMLSTFVYLFIIFVIERYIQFDKYTRLPRKNYILMAIIFIGSMIPAEIIVKAKYENKYLSVFGLGMICVIDLIYFYLFDQTLKFYRNEAQNSAINQQLKMYENQTKLLSQSNDKVRSFRHDYKNHIMLLKQYLQNGMYQEALQYTDKMSENIENVMEIVKTGNTGVDSILNYLLGQVDTARYDLKVKVNVPVEMKISDLDLNVILGNLLENAMEALQKQKNGSLEVQLNFDRNILYIHIKNSFLHEVVKNKKFFLTSKTDKESHGIGLQNVNKVVENYSGNMDIEKIDGMFVVNIIMYV